MKFKELKAMSKDEIKSKMKELNMELIKFNSQVATGTIPKNPGQLRQTKKTIAKIKQIMSMPEEKKAPAKKEIKEKSSSPKLESEIPNPRNEVSRKPKTEEKKE